MAKETKDTIGIEVFPLGKFVENDDNPRKVMEDTTQMVDSLLIFPKMLSVRPLAYAKAEDKLVVLGGNYRLRGLNEIAGYTLDIIKERLSGMIGWGKKSNKEQAALLAFWKKWLDEPVAYGICLDRMTVEEKKEFIIKDNLSYGQWDEEALRGWNREEVEEWGLNGINWDTKTAENAEIKNQPSNEWFLNIRFQDEVHCAEWLDKLTKEGLECKIIQ